MIVVLLFSVSHCTVIVMQTSPEVVATAELDPNQPPTGSARWGGGQIHLYAPLYRDMGWER